MTHSYAPNDSAPAANSAAPPITAGQYWRSLDELARTPEFEEMLHREFPQNASQWNDAVSRRRFLQLMGASIALAGLNGCSQPPDEKIVPFVDAPEGIVPGKPLYFATAMPLGGYGLGLLVQSHMGRPTKVEGNPEHPASLGATDIFAQASILGLYDPDRSQTVRYLGDISNWATFLTRIRERADALRAAGGAGLRLLTGSVTSPTFIGQMQALLKDFPQARWHRFDPLGDDNARAGARAAFGEEVHTVYRFDRANIVVALDVDFYTELPGSVRYAHDFMSRRKVYETGGRMNRLYTIASSPTLLGTSADHRLPMRSSDVEGFVRELARRLNVPGVADGEATLTSFEQAWLDALLADLQAEDNQASSLVVAGPSQPAAVHALVHAINVTLGNVAQSADAESGTVLFTRPIDAEAGTPGTLRELVDDIAAERVELLLILEGNPIYTAPANFKLEELLLSKKQMIRVHLSQHFDETSRLCHWHIPAAHYLESWSDVRAIDGTVSIIQPLIAPLYGGRTAHELLTVLSDRPELSSHQLVQQHWETQWSARGGQGTFAAFWQQALHDGLIPETEAEVLTPQLALMDDPTARAGNSESQLEIVFKADPTIRAGDFANNAWLQELPKPLTKITWDNVAQVSPVTAVSLAVVNGDLVTLRYRGAEVQAPVWITPGHADNSVTVFFGYGRSSAGSVGSGVGYNAYALRHSDSPWFGVGLEVEKTGEQHVIATTQHHWSMEGREIVRFGTQAEYAADEHFLQDPHDVQELPSLYPEYNYEHDKFGEDNHAYRWGMAIDQTACMGCNACVVACQSENNIPVVGKEEVLRGREMHWLRIDRYYYSGVDEGVSDVLPIPTNPETLFQPMLCQHCEKAPCEVVCPVAATLHDSEGLNVMVYNRCVGTRYCSNNCPYKVRRFNFFQYADLETPSLKLMRNPDVTVRVRGVMEKCTFCVQRISHARIEAKKQDRPIQDGELVTACQQACPTGAIVFGDLNDRTSRVYKLKQEPLNYGVLADLNTQPRVTYLGRLMNPNPALVAIEAKQFGRHLPEHKKHDPLGHETHEAADEPAHRKET